MDQNMISRVQNRRNGNASEHVQDGHDRVVKQTNDSNQQSQLLTVPKANLLANWYGRNLFNDRMESVLTKAVRIATRANKTDDEVNRSLTNFIASEAFKKIGFVISIIKSSFGLNGLSSEEKDDFIASSILILTLNENVLEDVIQEYENDFGSSVSPSSVLMLLTETESVKDALDWHKSKCQSWALMNAVTIAKLMRLPAVAEIMEQM